MPLSGGGYRRLRHAASARLLLMALLFIGNAVDGAAGAAADYFPSSPSVSSYGSNDFGTGDGSSAGLVPSDSTQDDAVEALSSLLRSSESSLATKIDAIAEITGSDLLDLAHHDGAPLVTHLALRKVEESIDFIHQVRDEAAAMTETMEVEAAMTEEVAVALQLHLPLMQQLSPQFESLEAALTEARIHVAVADSYYNHNGDASTRRLGLDSDHTNPNPFDDEWEEYGYSQEARGSPSSSSEFDPHGKDFRFFMNHFKKDRKRYQSKGFARRGGRGRRRRLTSSTTCEVPCPIGDWECECNDLAECSSRMSMNDLALFYVSGFVDEATGTVSNGATLTDARGQLKRKHNEILSLVRNILWDNVTTTKTMCSNLLKEFHTECEPGETCGADNSMFRQASVDEVCARVNSPEMLKFDEISRLYDEHRNLGIAGNFEWDRTNPPQMHCYEQPSVRVCHDFVRCTRQLHNQRNSRTFPLPSSYQTIVNQQKDPWMFGWANLEFPTEFIMNGNVLADASASAGEMYTPQNTPGLNGLCWDSLGASSSNDCVHSSDPGKDPWYKNTIDANSNLWYSWWYPETIEHIRDFDPSFANNERVVYCHGQGGKECWYKNPDGSDYGNCNDGGDTRFNNLVDGKCVVDISDNYPNDAVSCNNEPCYFGLSGCPIDPGDVRCQKSLELLFGEGASVGEVCSVAHSLQEDGDLPMPGTCCLDGLKSESRWGIGYTCDQDYECERYGPWLSWFSEAACDQVNGKWCPSPCTRLQKCLDSVKSDSDTPSSFLEKIVGVNITDASNQQECGAVREFLGFEADHRNDEEVCEALVNRKCDIINERMSAQSEYTKTLFDDVDFKELKQPDSTSYGKDKALAWKASIVALKVAHSHLKAIFQLTGAYKCISDPTFTSDNICKAAKNFHGMAISITLVASETIINTIEGAYESTVPLWNAGRREIYDQMMVLYRNMKTLNMNVQTLHGSSTENHETMEATALNLTAVQRALGQELDDLLDTMTRKLLDGASQLAIEGPRDHDSKSNPGSSNGMESSQDEKVLSEQVKSEGGDGLDQDHDSIIDNCEEDQTPPFVSFSSDAADLKTRAGAAGIVVVHPTFRSNEEAKSYLQRTVAAEDDFATDLNRTIEYVDGNCSETRYRASSVDRRCPKRDAAGTILILEVDEEKPQVSCGFDAVGHEERKVSQHSSSLSGSTLYLPSSEERFVDIGFWYKVKDNCGDSVAVEVNLSSNEYEDFDVAKIVKKMGSDGTQTAAVYVAPHSCANLSSSAFCAKEGDSSARQYTITVRATDKVGNIGDVTCSVYVGSDGVEEEVSKGMSKSVRRFKIGSIEINGM